MILLTDVAVSMLLLGLVFIAAAGLLTVLRGVIGWWDRE